MLAASEVTASGVPTATPFLTGIVIIELRSDIDAPGDDVVCAVPDETKGWGED